MLACACFLGLQVSGREFHRYSARIRTACAGQPNLGCGSSEARAQVGRVWGLFGSRSRQWRTDGAGTQQEEASSLSSSVGHFHLGFPAVLEGASPSSMGSMYSLMRT